MLVLAGSALATTCGTEQKTCPTIGCQDQVAVKIHNADFSTPPFAVEVQLGSAVVLCPPLELSRSNFAVCGPGVTITRQEQTTCQESSNDAGVSINCTGSGRFQLVLTVSGIPARFGATVKSGEVLLGQRTFEPVYDRVQPNGEGCGPICRQASETWALP